MNNYGNSYKALITKVYIILKYVTDYYDGVFIIFDRCKTFHDALKNIFHRLTSQEEPSCRRKWVSPLSNILSGTLRVITHTCFNFHSTNKNLLSMHCISDALLGIINIEIIKMYFITQKNLTDKGVEENGGGCYMMSFHIRGKGKQNFYWACITFQAMYQMLLCIVIRSQSLPELCN